MSDETEPRGLTPDLLALVVHLVRPLGAVADALLRQASAAHVVRSSATMLDVEVPPSLPPIDLADGPLPVRATVYAGRGLVGEVLVWVRDGRLVGLEQTWCTDEPPAGWPCAAQVRVE